MDKAEADACIDQVLAALPAELGDAIGELTIHVARDRQDRQTLSSAVRESGQGRIAIPQDFRGLYMGTPLDDTADEADRPTGVIVLNAAMLRDEQDVLDTLLHEIGHALGYDEEEIAALGLE